MMSDLFFANRQKQAVLEKAAVSMVQLFKRKTLNAYSGKSQEELSKELTASIKKSQVSTEEELIARLEELATPFFQHCVNPHHPHTLAHLHCPTVLPSVIGDFIIGMTNQSLDSWDQAPYATMIEKHMIEIFNQKVGFSDDGDGVFTSGGTQSNLMGLLLAREHNHNGLILVSEKAHFSFVQGAFILGIPKERIISVKVDDRQRMIVSHIEQLLQDLQGHTIAGIMATAGTTDFGSIDFLHDLSNLAKKHHAYFHVDAAYGGILLTSQSYRKLLAGIDQADSVTIDFHKGFFQSISCGAFLVKDASRLKSLRHEIDYLDRDDDEAHGFINLVGKSLQTSRSADAFKIFLSWYTMGEAQFACSIEHTIELARKTATLIKNDSNFDLYTWPALSTVVFRTTSSCAINQAIRRALWFSGQGIIGQTKIDGKVYFKFTLMNPMTTIEDIKDLIHSIKDTRKRLIEHDRNF